MSMNMDEHEHGDNEHVFSLVDHARRMQWLHGQNVTSCSLTIQLDFVFDQCDGCQARSRRGGAKPPAECRHEGISGICAEDHAGVGTPWLGMPPMPELHEGGRA